MSITIIAALTKQRVIGKDNKLLWHIPEDLKNFKKITSGHPVVMGRKTYESISAMVGGPLPKRRNIVVSRSGFSAEGVDVFDDLASAIAEAGKTDEDVFIIGGAMVYKLALEQGLADKMLLSWVKKEYEGDAYFPEFSMDDWTEVKREDMGEFEFVEYELVG